ncbi:MAG: hypothetical protein H6845_01770 [Alphaproteobacteria bacterium]|nr:MAG: hypothetical protein H6845_01770 [Alphaproteobacteria bacterium]
MLGLVKISGSYFSTYVNELEDFISTPLHGVVLMSGGGNIVRGREFSYSNRLFKDRMGIMSTVINGISLAEKFDAVSRKVHLASPVCAEDIINKYDPYVIKNILSYDHKTQVILCGGLGWCGNLSTDTAMVVRALELSCTWVCKVSNVGGVFNDDPAISKSAKMMQKLTYADAIQYKAYDAASIVLARENKLKLMVTSLPNLKSHLIAGNFNSFCGTVIEE